jgi:hypothetical protein
VRETFDGVWRLRTAPRHAPDTVEPLPHPALRATFSRKQEKEFNFSNLVTNEHQVNLTLGAARMVSSSIFSSAASLKLNMPAMMVLGNISRSTL